METIFSRRARLSAVVALAAAIFTVSGCNDDPTTVVVQNNYPADDGGGGSAAAATVFKTWWVTTLFASPVPPGAASETERTIPGADYAYALLAPGWSPDSGLPPARLIPIKSAQKLTVAAHDLLTIPISDQTFVGDCAAGSTLDADDARLIVEQIFSGAFSNTSYDPATCTSTPIR